MTQSLVLPEVTVDSVTNSFKPKSTLKAAKVCANMPSGINNK